jgi:peptidoglycan/xylan/chitin deacetylase (PgdA/CDA1 family)
VGAVKNAIGQPPVGWCSPALQPSAHSVDLLLEEGFVYSMDFADDDIPYVVERPAGRLVAIPYQYDLNDMGLYAYTRQPPSVYFEFFKRKFDYLYAEGVAGDPKMLNATVHAQLFGRAFGASVLEECIRYAQQFSGVWFARRDDIARWVLKG